MTTMAAKLKGKAEVVRRLNKERKALKRVTEVSSKRTGIDDMMVNFYNAVWLAQIDTPYSRAELHKMLDMCIKVVEQENRESRKRIKAMRDIEKGGE